jgi:glutamyl-tRNA reductase
MLLDSALETEADPAVIVLATRTAGPLLRSSRSRGLVVDLCAPSAVDAALRPVLGARLVDLDRLGHATNALPAAVERRLRAELADERDRFVAWLAERTAMGRIVELRSAAEDARRRHLDRLRGHGDLAEQQLAAVERMTIALVNELLHEQTIRLRRQAQPR